MDPSETAKYSIEAKNIDRVLHLLDDLVDLSHADSISPSRHNAAYKASVVLWMLTFQRMSSDKTMEACVKELVRTKPSILPSDNKRVIDGLSDNTAAYSRARSRMKLDASKWLAETVSNSLIAASPSTFQDQQVYTLDGTTVKLSPDPLLRKLFPPATEASAWPIAILVVAHELSSGAALLPQIGAMYGENAVSETAMIDQSLKQIPDGSLVMADSNFGIFSVAHQITMSNKRFTLRLTAQRFESLRKRSRLIDQGDNYRTWSCTWKPSVKDRAGRPQITRESVLDVWIHEIVVHADLTVYLVTDQDYHSLTFADLYKQRGNVEIDIRNFKIVLDAQNILAQSQDTFEKELYASVVAYNLITQFRRQAATEANVTPRQLSFKRVCTTFRVFLMGQAFNNAIDWINAYNQALEIAKKQKLPNRPGRSYKREVYTRNINPHNFEKRIPRRLSEADSG